MSARSTAPRRIGRALALLALAGCASAAPCPTWSQPAPNGPMLAGAPRRAIRPPLATPTDTGVPEAISAPSDSVASTGGLGGAQVVRVATGRGETRQLSLPRGRAAVVELPVDARDVMVSNPKIAEVALSTPRRIYVTGVASGQTDAMFMDGMGRQILRLDIRVDQDAHAVAQTIARFLPGTSIHVDSANDSLVLSGEAANAAEADKAARLATAFVTDPKQVINMIAVAGGEQVKLRVKIVEVNRQVIKQLGFDLSTVIGQLGGPQYTFGKAVTYGVQGALLGGLSGAGYNYNSTQQPIIQNTYCSAYTLVGGVNTCTGYTTNPATYIDRTNKLSTIQANSLGTRGVNQATSTLQAFERVGLARTLAEPELTAISGESARFLAGGEFPVPASEDAAGRVTVDYKQYGVGLGFTPVVLSSGRISLKISTEVSEISSVGGFTTGGATTASGGGTPSLTIPGLTVRRAETVVELPSGGAMAIAGLLQSQSKQTLDQLPGLGQVPILGSLLRSRDFQNNESELVVIVTPYLVKPVRPEDLQTPADGLRIASDVETNLLGRLNTGFGKPAAAPAGQTYQGPFGYVVD